MDTLVEQTAASQTLFEKALTETRQPNVYNLAQTKIGQDILAAPPYEQSRFVLDSIVWLDLHHNDNAPWQYWTIYAFVSPLLRHKLPFTHDEVIRLLTAYRNRPDIFVRHPNDIAIVVAHYLVNNRLTTELEGEMRLFIAEFDNWRTTITRKAALRFRELLGDQSILLPLNGRDLWATTASNEILQFPHPAQIKAWNELLNACLKTSGSAPSGKWLKTTTALVEAVTWPAFKNAILRWFPLVNQPRTNLPPPTQWYVSDPAELDVDDADILKGLVWLCSQQDDPEITHALFGLALSTYKKLPGRGPRCPKVGNACVWALGNMPGTLGIAQLAILKVRIKGASIQNAIEKALTAAANRTGLLPEEIEEMSIPPYGLEEVGLRRVEFGDYKAEVVVTGSDVELRWWRPDGKQAKSVPQAVKTGYAAQVKELTQSVKDIRAMLPAQRERINNLYLQQRKWSYATWRKHYLDHPLVGTLARRLIWKFSAGDKAASGIWHANQIVDRDDRPLDWLTDTTQVELWHPLETSTEIVLNWRAWLTRHQVQQPFKQAHREIYVLTEAERNTHVYSNRFAAHIIRQHQFNSLCAARGWKNQLRLMVDASYNPPMRYLPQWGLRAEFWVEGIGDNYQTDVNQSGTYLYLATDQVRFYNETAMQNWAHAGGGGYVVAEADHDFNQPLPLESIPPLVFSEIMRDVDLFVGVASIGNDPNWLDGGTNQRHREYWNAYSFGDLSENAKTRREILEPILPVLKISSRCSLADKFLVVRGDIRTYKIHLGSGNILMEPNDQYLCIVPARGAAGGGLNDKLFLPFEGDGMLSIILSKAFLLADDRKITDSTILRQLKRG